MHDAKVRTLAVRLGDMVNDSRVQRGLDHKRVHSIAEDFSIEAIGVLTLSARDDGTFSIIDGQHRYHALREKEYTDDFKVTSRVFYGLSLADEAMLFRLLNNTRKPLVLDIFRVRVIEGDPTAVAISNMLAHHGWIVQSNVTGREDVGAFRAVAAIEKIWSMDPVSASTAVSVLTHMWGNDHNSNYMDGRLVEAFGLLLMRHGGEIDLEGLMRKISKNYNADQLIGSGIARKKALNSNRSVAENLMESIIRIYNRGLRKGKLPERD